MQRPTPATRITIVATPGLSADRPSHHMAPSHPDAEEGNRLYAVGYFLHTPSGRRSRTRRVEFCYATSDTDAFALVVEQHRDAGEEIWMDTALPVYPTPATPATVETAAARLAGTGGAGETPEVSDEYLAAAERAYQLAYESWAASNATATYVTRAVRAQAARNLTHARNAVRLAREGHA